LKNQRQDEAVLVLSWWFNSSLPSQRMDQKPSEELRTGKDVRA